MEMPLKQIFLKDFDGGITPFDARTLQTRLIDSFLDAGRGDVSYLAEDIALALEYTLLEAPRPDPVFGTGEVDAAVIRILEETGFPEVARCFRSSGSESSVLVSTQPEMISALLQGHLGCSDERMHAVTLEVAQAFRKLEIGQAPPHLLLELARYYERCRAEKELLSESSGKRTSFTTLAAAEIAALLPTEPRLFAEGGVLQISSITSLFPSVRFFFRMEPFARMHELAAPLTELELMPLLYPAGKALESARLAIIGKTAQPSPCCLTFPDMNAFLTQYCGPGDHRELAEEIASAVAGEIGCPLYKLSIR